MTRSFANWRDVPAEFWVWPHFTPAEFRCRESGRLVVAPGFMDRLEALRAIFDRPIRVNSGYRAPAYNARISKSGLEGPHTTGRAGDFAVAGIEAWDLEGLARDAGFTGIGVMQRGDWAGRYLHLDDLETAPGRPRPRLWSY